MYREARSVNKNPQVSVVQIMMSIGIVVVALILPIYAVEKIRNTTPVPYSAQALSNSSASVGRVAGVSTVLGESKITIPFTTTQVDTTSQEGMLLIAGGVLIVVAAVIILYLIATSGRHHKTNRR